MKPQDVHAHFPRKLQGRGLSAGVGHGTAYRIEPLFPRFIPFRISADEVSSEVARFRQAVVRSRHQYQADKAKLEKLLGKDHSYIIDAHILMLEDQQLLGAIEERIAGKLESPEKAVRHVADDLLAVYQSLEDEFFQDRSFDFEEVIERVLANLLELGPEGAREVSEDLILVASEIGLSLLTQFPLDRIKGLVLTRGGETSHVVIVARSFQIPVVAGVPNLHEVIQTGESVLVDGTSGSVVVGGPQEELRRARVSRDDREREVLDGILTGPCDTPDGQRVHLLANAELAGEVQTALSFGAEGIGLFRSEYVYFMGQKAEDEEDYHFRYYREVAVRCGSRPAAIRTVDIAGKNGAGQNAGEETGALGLRGVRWSLRNPDLFRLQARAIIRARQFGDLQIVLPMVTSVDEVVAGKTMIREIEAELGIPWERRTALGALLEVPAAVLTLDSIAEECDFLAVGTNDLIQYLLAAGRLNQEVSYLYNPLHPAVLGVLARIVETAAALGRDVTVCGEMAAHPQLAAVLTGLGFRRLSMNAFSIPRVKQALVGLDSGFLSALAADLLSCRSPAACEALLEERLAFGKVDCS